MKSLLLYLSSIFILIYLPSALFAASKPKEERTEEGPEYIVPQGVPRWITVFSNLEKNSMTEILQFINKSTGLNCKLNEESGRSLLPDGDYDIYIGINLNDRSLNIHNYDSSLWAEINPEYKKRGVYTWSKWSSCLAVNNVIEENFSIYRSNVLRSLKGKMTMADPADDAVTLSIIGTLYRLYGKEILIDINNTIPFYRDTGEDLVFTIESGQYSSAIGISGYFKKSMIAGYPIDIFYESFNSNKYPVTTVSGTNIVYIPETSSNKEGAEFLIDFLAKSLFQTFLLNTYFTPIIEVPTEEETGFLFPEVPENTLPFDPDLSAFEEVLIIWNEILYPKGVRELVE